MSNETCILTTKDFTILEVMLDRCLGRDDPLAPILKRKIDSALVVFRDDVPENVATLSSRVTFSVDGRDPDTRVISHDRMTSPVGMYLPISTLRGLALLGLAEGQEFVLTNADGDEERIELEKVHYQPEAARREKEAMERLNAPTQRKPALRLIQGAFADQPRFVPVASTGFDDPGPSAA
jgi:regulator of nucleoside diphosphate kinase